MLIAESTGVVAVSLVRSRFVVHVVLSAALGLAP
jgi:hypothetical protein